MSVPRREKVQEVLVAACRKKLAGNWLVSRAL
jgi:hypothetical protein